MDWNITETNKLTPEDIDRQGNKLLIGNGYIGYRGTLEEFNKEQKTATIVSGLYDKVGDLWREPINLPNGCFVQVIYKGEPLHVLSSKVVAHTQGIDMRSAVHVRQTTFETSDGNCITIRSRRFASLARHHLICIEYSISANHECEVDIQTGIDGDVWDINGPHLEEMETCEDNGILTAHAITHENRVPVAVAEAVSFSDNHQLQEYKKEKSTLVREIRGLKIHKGFTLHKFVSHVTGLEESSPLDASRELCKQAAALSFDELLSEHVALWARRWEDCDIQITGDEEAQQALRFSMYHLLAIVPTHTEYASIPARGMSGQMYKGAIFWDTEIFMLPFFTHAFPKLARNLLLYRYHTLDGARRKAQEYGFRGAYYAWESQDTGDDACTLFNVTDVFTNRPMRTYFRDKQVHISADVVYAFWKYYSLTGDASIWRDGGAEVVFECARFFLSSIYFSPDKHRYEILDVTGPDEYHERVHNNAFTNRMIANTLEVCQQVANHLQETSPDFFGKLKTSLDFESDLALINGIIPDLYLPDSNPTNNLIPQFDNYFTLENIPLETLLERKLHPTEYLGGGSGIATTTQIIKQADVVLMLYLFGERYSLETKSVNWEYYEPRTEHGSSLSACSYSLIAAQIGKVDWAYKYFMKTAIIDLEGKGKQYVGTLYIGGTHPAGNGGAWMSAVFGLCGIHCINTMITVNPHLPAHWEQVVIPLSLHGQKMRITLTHDSIGIRSLHPLEVPLTVSVGDAVYPLHPTDAMNIATH
ncbi:MAG TPA: glycosyl hydrolase family 65 protein [Anaerolineales bacterium]|nr:glycosyl hydrolase family 65 protein [Anaerolineales bacterium]